MTSKNVERKRGNSALDKQWKSLDKQHLADSRCDYNRPIEPNLRLPKQHVSTMDAPQIAIAIESLQQPANLSFLTLSDAVLSSGSIADSNGARSSNIASTDGLPGSVTPAFLMAELAHYQELFSKLRLMYVEQVTKERLLKAIAADPPQLADARENDALAEQLVTEKAALKAKKEEVARMTKGLEEMGRNLVRCMYHRLAIDGIMLNSKHSTREHPATNSGARVIARGNCGSRGHYSGAQGVARDAVN